MTRYGARPVAGGGFEFCVWAERQKALRLRLDGREMAMVRNARGEFRVQAPEARAGQDYQFVLDSGDARPDPASRWQPYGVHGASRLCDGSCFGWTDQDWRGLELKDYVFYELHTGTFTERGTFEAVVERLDHLVTLGVTAVELMPVAEFPGGRNWGYDGVALYAPQSSYGGPEGLRTLVNACHERGLAVVLDVVYNHLGPEGNYLGEFAGYFTGRHQTPWGNAVDYSREEVRRFFLDNAIYWMREFHVDALRLDAVHGIFDDSADHILAEMAREVAAFGAQTGRRVYLIAESERGDVRGCGIDSIWHDEFHHALAPLLTGNRRGYLGGYGKREQAAQAAGEGFVLWEAGDEPWRPEQLVAFVQNHDQVANAFLGDRQGALLTVQQQQVAAAVLCFSPWLPLLFMGQEYGESNPFLYFISHSDRWLIEAVRKGRRREFEPFYGRRPFPDPQDGETFERCKLDWGKVAKAGHAEVLASYRDLLRFRKLLRWPGPGEVRARSAEGCLVIERPEATLAANLSAEERVVQAAGQHLLWSTGHVVDAGGEKVRLGPWSAAIYFLSSSGVTGSINGQLSVPMR